MNPFLLLTLTTLAPPDALAASLQELDPQASSHFCASCVARCMARAARAMRVYDQAYEALACGLRDAHPVSIAARDPEIRPEAFGMPGDVFARFDGAWRGRWGLEPVRHLWYTVHASTQLVVIEEGGRVKRGINYLDSDGVICGLVEDIDVPLRLHHALWRPATPELPAHLEWRTPQRIYQEWTTPDTYHIQEIVPGKGRGFRARYKKVHEAHVPVCSKV